MLTDKQWNVEALLLFFFGVLICLFVGAFLVVFLGNMLEGDKDHAVWRTVAATMSFQGGTLVLTHLFLRRHGMRWSEAFGFANQWRRALLLGLLVVVLFLPVGIGLQWASAKLMTGVDLEPIEQPAVQTLRITQSWFSRAVLAVVTIGLAPLAEEILFRGVLYPAVKQAGFRRLALWGTSVLFAMIHGNLTVFLPLLVLSVALTLLYERTNNLLAPIFAHALFNGVNFVRLYSAP